MVIQMNDQFNGLASNFDHTLKELPRETKVQVLWVVTGQSSKPMLLHFIQRTHIFGTNSSLSLALFEPPLKLVHQKQTAPSDKHICDRVSR